MPSLQNADVVVIGGGPAGSSAAITAAQKGLSVIVIEARSFPRDRPGETLHPGIAPLLKQLGIWSDLPHSDILRHSGHWVETETEEQFEAFGSDQSGPWHGFQILRATLDTALLNQAKKLGVRILQPCHSHRLIVTDQQITGVATHQGNITCQYVIDAAGGNHWLARTYHPTIQSYSAPLTAFYGYAKGHCPNLPSLPRLKVDAQGWTWIAQIQPQLYQWTRLDIQNGSCDRTTPYWMPPELQNLAPQGKIRKENVTWRKLDKPAGVGYFSAGDAAFVLDPGSSHGVLKAMMSGMMASHAIAQILGGEATEIFATQSYCTWINHWFHQDLQHLVALYANWGWTPLLKAPQHWHSTGNEENLSMHGQVSQ